MTGGNGLAGDGTRRPEEKLRLKSEFRLRAESRPQSKAKQDGIVMLEGKALLDKARTLSSCSEDEIARACGYVSPGGRLLKKSFYRALVEAKGYRLAGSSPQGGGSKGRQAEFRTRVHGNGNLMIGNAYTRRMGLEPGQEFQIQIHAETGAIWLLPLNAEPE